MAASPTYAIRGSARAQAAIAAFFMDEAKLERGAEDLIFPYLRQVMRSTFQTQGAEIGESWPQYTGDEAQYGAIKRRILGDVLGRSRLTWEPQTGRERLRPSLVEAGHSDQVAEVRGSVMRFGTTVPYAINHQEGVGRGPEWAGFPAVKKRTFLRLRPKHVAQIRRLMAQVTGI